MLCVVFFKQKTAYEMRISDWSSDVCSSDLMFIEPKANGISIVQLLKRVKDNLGRLINVREDFAPDVDKEARVNGILDILQTGRVILLAGPWKIGRASCRERVCQYV